MILATRANDMAPVTDHPLRYRLANELHARPFPSQPVPGQVAFLALRPLKDAASRDRDAERAHLIDLLDRHGAPHPQPEATHYSGDIGRYHLKWESHTEFVTFTVFAKGKDARAFDPAGFDVFPPDWLEDAPGLRMTSLLIRVESGAEPKVINPLLAEWFVPESLAVAHVLDKSAVIAGDFRIDAAGHSRFALFVAQGTGPQRTGRIVQRLCEIETYKTMSMLGFARAREMQAPLGRLADDLSGVVGGMDRHDIQPEAALKKLLTISAQIEQLEANSSFRFGATDAYEAIVSQRIGVLREERYEGQQTFDEFMMRRFDPAMRTVKSTKSQLESVSARARRASDLLRTLVDVERSAQNQALLESMDRRADLQLRLQQTVEGLSVVAISYYALNIAGYLAYPALEPLGLSKGVAMAVLTLPVVGAVWLMVRRIRRGMGH